MVFPDFVGRRLGPKAGARGRGEDGCVDAWLGRQREKAVVADDGELNGSGRAEQSRGKTSVASER
jgi:hypothetical protein